MLFVRGSCGGAGGGHGGLQSVFRMYLDMSGHVGHGGHTVHGGQAGGGAAGALVEETTIVAMLSLNPLYPPPGAASHKFNAPGPTTVTTLPVPATLYTDVVFPVTTAVSPAGTFI